MARAFSNKLMASTVRLDMNAWVPSRWRASTFSLRRTRRLLCQLMMACAVCCNPTTNVTTTAPIAMEMSTKVTGLSSISTVGLVRTSTMPGFSSRK